jgi:hypothetical protein
MVVRIVLMILFASSVYADVKVRDGRVSVDLQSQPLTQVLERLKSQTNMRMVMDEGISGKTVSASFQDLPVGLALKKILEGTGINYAVLAGADGEPQSVFIGGSSRPGVPPRRLDNRPTGTRGVVTPVPPQSAPLPPIQQQPDILRQQQQQQLQQQQQQQQPLPEKSLSPALNVPTGGGFVPEQPGQNTPPEIREDQQQEPQERLDDED